MKDILEKLGLTEFFAYLSPGAIVLCSFALWGKPRLGSIIGSELAKQQCVVVALLLILCYMLGMIVSLWGCAGARQYVAMHGRKRARYMVHGTLNRLTWGWLYAFHRLPLPASDPWLVGREINIALTLREQVGLEKLSKRLTPWDWLTTYRSLMSEKAGGGPDRVVADAESAHRRLLFCLGVSLAVSLIALQSFAKLGLLVVLTLSSSDVSRTETWAMSNTDWINVLPLAAMTVVGVLISFGLRQAAGQWWERELILTCSLAKASSEKLRR